MEKLKKPNRKYYNKEKPRETSARLWYEEWRAKLTASNFGLICNRKPFSSCRPVVNKLLYTYFNFSSLKWSKAHGQMASQELETKFIWKWQNVYCLLVRSCLSRSITRWLKLSRWGKLPANTVDLTPYDVIEEKVGEMGKMWKRRISEDTLEIKKMYMYHFHV